MKISGTTVVSGVIALIMILCATFVGLAVTGHLDANSTPLLTMILGLTATTISTLLVAIKADGIAHDLRNGLIESKVGDALATNDNAKSAIATVAKQATTEALEEKQVVTRDGPYMSAQLEALSTILQHIDSVNKTGKEADNGGSAV